MKVIKLGGSIITYKGSDSAPPYRWKESNLHYRMRENSIRTIARVIRDHMDEGLILVHGGGTHGHRTVQRWKIQAAKGKECQRIWEVKWRMLQLTEKIVNILGEEKVPVVAVSPSDILELEGKRICDFSSEPIMKLLDNGCIPMLRGDLAPERSGGWSVMSGDEIMVEIVVQSLKGGLPSCTQAIMCLDIEGFYKDLGGPTQELIRTILADEYHINIGKWKNIVRSGDEKGDVSGGVLRKVESCHRIAAMGTDACMIGGDIRRSLEKALSSVNSGTIFPSFMGDDNCKEGKCGQG